MLSPPQVLTCGRDEYTGHGPDNNIPRMTPLPKLQHVAVQQVRDMTYTSEMTSRYSRTSGKLHHIY